MHQRCTCVCVCVCVCVCEWDKERGLERERATDRKGAGGVDANEEKGTRLQAKCILSRPKIVLKKV